MFRLGNHTHHIRPNLVAASTAGVSLLALVAALAPPVAAAPAPSVVASAAGPEKSFEESLAVSLAEVGGGLRTAEVPIDAVSGAGQRRAPGRTQGPVSQSTAVDTDGVSMVAMTWTGRAPQQLQVRARASGAWQAWRDVPVLADGPDVGSKEAGGVGGASDLLWVGPARSVQVRSATGFDAGTQLVLLDTTGEPAPTLRPSARGGAELTGKAIGLAGGKATGKALAKKAPKSAPRPRLRLRKKWGANESWREGKPVHGKRIRQIHVHHTVNSNDYRRKDVPGILRGIYRYHTKSLGWSDIGYNVLVDRFGRAWIGRAGGVAKRVQGAHTLGFNHNSSGVAVIGNFENRTPRKAVRRRIAGIAAWLLDREGSRARGKVVRVSTGSDLYAKGRKVKLPIIDGHRDTNQTACPGERLYKRLPAIRRMAQRRVDRF